jgi:hypothetical protein
VWYHSTPLTEKKLRDEDGAETETETETDAEAEAEAG